MSVTVFHKFLSKIEPSICNASEPSKLQLRVSPPFWALYSASLNRHMKDIKARSSSWCSNDFWYHCAHHDAQCVLLQQLVFWRMNQVGKIGSTDNSHYICIALFWLSNLSTSCLLPQAFVDFFSRALEFEYRNSGITVQTLVPSYISTNMTKYSDLVHKPSEYLKHKPSSGLLTSRHKYLYEFILTTIFFVVCVIVIVVNLSSTWSGNFKPKHE